MDIARIPDSSLIEHYSAFLMVYSDMLIICRISICFEYASTTHVLHDVDCGISHPYISQNKSLRRCPNVFVLQERASLAVCCSVETLSPN